VHIDDAAAKLPLSIQSSFETQITYLESLQVLPLLEKVQLDKNNSVRNFFGSYASEELKSWDKIIKLYKYQNVSTKIPSCAHLV
jgi:hypothetical protein